MLRSTIIFLAVYLFAIGELFAQSPSAQSSGVKYIESFYTAYVKAFDSDDDEAFNLLMEQSLTPELREKIELIVGATGSDPILRAQDVAPDLLKTLKVEPKGNGWYLVSYASYQGSSDRISIPMKVSTVGSKFYISYITPEWNGEKFGDQLLYHDVPAKVDESSALSFLRSFYMAYAATYCLMPVGLASKLDVLRRQYCTESVRDMIVAMEEESESPCYDLLIGYNDFDPLWLPTVKVLHSGGNQYAVSYMMSNHSSDRQTMNVTVVQRNGKYLIDGVEVDE